MVNLAEDPGVSVTAFESSKSERHRFGGYELPKPRAIADTGKITNDDVYPSSRGIKYLRRPFSKVLHLTMKKYWISFYFLAGMAQLAVWKDKVMAEIGVWPSIVVAIGYLLVLGMLGFLAARGVEAIGKLAALKQNRAIENFKQKDD